MLELEEVTEYEAIDQNAPLIEAIKALDNLRLKPARENWDAYWRGFEKPADPTYLQRTNTFRWRGRYVRAHAGTEALYAAELNRRLFKRYLKGAQGFAEFGCGSGKNLLQMCEFDPQVRRYGYDWSASAVSLVSGIAHGKVFDMQNPAQTPELRAEIRLAVYTSGSMEQLGDNFRPFLDYLLSLKAAVYVHVEPILEFYRDDKVFDYVAREYHARRGYLGRYLTELRADTGVKIEHCDRMGFGNFHNEGYSVIVWHVK